jgi:hypothetical protein
MHLKPLKSIQYIPKMECIVHLFVFLGCTIFFTKVKKYLLQIIKPWFYFPANHSTGCDAHFIECDAHFNECDAYCDECDAHFNECDAHFNECDAYFNECDAYCDECDAHCDECDAYCCECDSCLSVT